ncbi:vitamin K-dependent gamma-carboxylase [Drosophila willistoni]|uniref:vitamin K-dependent gamma-carboxylase n=1 Tax=Drosophila willistoni TaxID=7260 RepID=UPI001F07CB30|nr:vitamin K-dependent gamma-carboxylase [Drosophila willistoni]XP_023033859.2 vitamin K-dependent gamma-carboxylase [Drosophila willistoni]
MANSKRKQLTKTPKLPSSLEQESKSTDNVIDNASPKNVPPDTVAVTATTASTAHPTPASSPTAAGHFFRLCSGYELSNFSNLDNFTNWLQRPVDGSALGVFRMLYGAAMLIDIAEERGGGQLDVRYGEPQHCHFPLFNSISALAYPLMGCVYLCMWLGAWGILLGYRFRLSCLCFIVPYWYIFLLDKPTWNNHSYLFGLVGLLLLFTRAESYCSLDRLLSPHSGQGQLVPYWNYFLIKFQFFLLYAYAGLKKFSPEWLSGYAMSNLSQHWVFAPFRQVLDAELIDLLIVHWFTAFFDLSIAFFMTVEKTRLLVTPFMISFHLMNSRLFHIGMFPWVCLAEVPLFFGFDWPRKMLGRPIAKHASVEVPTSCKKPRLLAKLRTVIICGYCGLQLFLPYSHFITKGYNNWTNGLYGYSWDMMMHSYDTVLTSIKVVDNDNQRVHNLNPYAFTEYDRWTKYADMAVQYAKCIERNIQTDMAKHHSSSPLIGQNISIFFDIWCSMNGRFQQRTFDPRVDLLKAPWSPFEPTPWSLPLLTELNHMRPKLRTITTEVLAWNNYSDVIFVADFPGLMLSNFISPDLNNCTLTILEGNVRYKSEKESEAFFLTAGKSIALESNTTHYVTTIGHKPASYLYTFVNKTMLEHSNDYGDDGTSKSRPLLPLWDEFQQRVTNYQNFLIHLGNCVLYLLYGVPIPLAIRDVE